MFKKLREKIEGVGISPSKSQPSSPNAKDAPDQEEYHPPGDTLNSRRPIPETPEKTPTSRGAHPSEPVIVHDLVAVDGSPSVTNDGPAELPVSPMSQESVSRSRTSSVSSMSSEPPLFPAYTTPQRQYYMPSDIESASEYEDSSPSLDHLSKDDLFQLYSKMQRRSQRYKAKCGQAISAYKEVEADRDKLKRTLTQAQDKAFRRISELKEQIQLDKFAKQHLEENYSFMLEERDELVKVLQTQIHLLKEGKVSAEELVKKAIASLEKSSSAPPGQQGKGEGDAQAESGNIGVYKEKVKRLENLLSKCKDTIKNNKEKSIVLNHEKEELQQQINHLKQQLDSSKNSDDSEKQKFKSQILEARKVIQQLEVDKAMAVAESKQQFHTLLEEKDTEIDKFRATSVTLSKEKEELTVKLQKLEATAREQIERAKEIIKKKKVPTATLR